MSTPAEQQQALDELQTPASLDRITRFLSDLGEQGNTPLGTSGRSAQAFAASLAGGAGSFSARQASGWVAILMDRYQVKIGEIQEFALWFVRRQEILSQTTDLVERAPEPVLARPLAPDPVLARPSAAERAAGAVQVDRMGEAPAAADGSTQTSPTQTSPTQTGPTQTGPTQTGLSAPPQGATLRRQAVTASPAAMPPSEGGPGWEAEDAGPTTPEERPRRRRAEPKGETATGSPRRRIERGPITARDDAPPGDHSQKDVPSPGMPEEEAPPARRPFRLMPHMITRPAFVTNVGLAGMLAGLSLAPSSAMAQDAPDMALALPPMSGSGPTGGPLPTYPSLEGTAPLGVPAFTPMSTSHIASVGMPALTQTVFTQTVFTQTVTPLVPAAVMPPPSTVWLGMPASAPPLPAAVPDTASPGAMASPLVQAASTPGAVSPTPLAPAMTLLPGVSPESLGVQAAPAPQAVGGQLPASIFTPQMGAPRLPSGVPVSPLLLVVPPTSQSSALMGLAAGSAALAAQQQIQAASPVPSASPPATPQPASPTLALMGLAAGSAALSIADRFRSSQSQPAPDGTRLLPTGTAPPFAVAPPSPMTMFMGSESGTAVLDATLTTDTPGRGMIAPVSPFAVTPEMGQLTLMAPPLQIASTQAERGGIAASVDWQTLAVGVGPLDEGGLSRLKQVLPMQTSVLYPALPPGSLGQGAVNLPLSASLVQSLLQKGYGNPGMGTATRAVDMATSAGGGKPPAAPLTAQIIPGRRPAGAAAGVFGHPDEMQGGAGALGQAGKGQAARGGVLDFLGLPVRLAPSLGGRSDLARETTLRSTGQGLIKPQQTLRPEQFAPLRNRLFPAFSSMAVEPDKAAWRKAAPAFGLRDGSPTTLLAPDARIPVQTPTMSQPPSRSRPPVSSPSAALLGGPHEASLISPLMAVAGHRAAVTPGHPGTPSAYTPSASLTHGLPPAVGAWAAAHTPLQGLGGSLTAPVRGPSLSFPAAYPPTHGRHGAPLTAIYPGPASSGPGLGPSGLGVIGGVGHHLPLGASLHHPSSRASHASHAPPPFSQVPSALGAAHLPSGLAYRRAMPESLPGSGPFLGVGSLAQNRLATTPRSRGGAFLLPAASVVGSSTRSSTGGGSHTTFPTALPGPAGGLSGRRLPRSGAFVPLGGRSVSHSRLAHTNARPLGSHLSLPTSRPVSSLHPVSASGPSLGNAPGSSHTPGDGGGRRIASPGFIGSPSAALALPHRTLTPMHFPDSRIVRSPGPTSPVTTRAVWPESLTPVSRRQKGGGVVGGFGGPAPAMRLAPPRPVRRTDVDTSATPPMTIQRSETTTTATPAQNRSAQPHTKAASGPSGSVAGEVNALAGEVWSLLKRRLATEAERRGRW